MKTPATHPKIIEIRVSKCCGTQTVSVPPCFGDPEIVICKTCNTICDADWLPMYYEVSKGTYRKADYTIIKNSLTL